MTRRIIELEFSEGIDDADEFLIVKTDAIAREVATHSDLRVTLIDPASTEPIYMRLYRKKE